MKFKLAALSVLLWAGCLNFYGQSNILLNREFWKSQPTLTKVQEAVAEGNDPAQLNSNSFDPMVYALLEHAPDSILKYLLTQKGNQVDKITHDGRTYLFWAAYASNLPFMKYLVEKGAATNLVDEHGYSVFNFAALAGVENKALYDFLIAEGVNPVRERTPEGTNTLMLLLPHLTDTAMVNYFINKGISLASTDNSGNTSFSYAARGGNIDMLDWLIKKGVSPKRTTSSGENAFHFAARGMRGHSNSPEVFKYLFSKGLDPLAIDADGLTPLMIYASRGDDPVVVQFFLEKGAHPDQRDNKGNTALIHAAHATPLMLQPLISSSKQINAANDKGQTALMLAAGSNTASALELLLNAGADVSLTDKEGNSVVYYLFQGYDPKEQDRFDSKLTMLQRAGVDFAAPQSEGNTVQHLAAAKADWCLSEIALHLTPDINAVNDNGLTALHLAAMSTSDLDLLKFLIASGADPAILTPFGESAYDLAMENELLKFEENNFEFLKKEI